jgi:hypothetical protein
LQNRQTGLLSLHGAFGDDFIGVFAMADDRQLLIGKWTVWVKDWIWEYEFFPNETVNWRDTRSLEKGSGRWSMSHTLLNLVWLDSATKESWQLPLSPLSNKRTWYSATYYTGSYRIEKALLLPAPSSDELYTGFEDSIDLPEAKPPEDNLFYPPVSSPHRGGVLKPIYDGEAGAIIGYMHSNSGYYEFYDLSGRMIGSDEIPVEEPLVDPIDFVFLVGGLARGVGRTAIKLGVRAAASVGSKAVIRGLTSVAFAGMRSAFRTILSVRTLKFTATTAQRMATKGRYVPTHLLKMAIRYGAREPDPQGVKGAFKYTLKLIRSDPNIAPGLNPSASWAGKTYTLNVVVKEELTSSTVLHFHYQ